MKKIFLLIVLCLSFLNAEDCVCFELKGEFGEEIKAILKKYSKNLGAKDIQVIREDEDLTLQEKNFLESLIGTGKVNSANKQANLENGEKLFKEIVRPVMEKMQKFLLLISPLLTLGKPQILLMNLKTTKTKPFKDNHVLLKTKSPNVTPKKIWRILDII